jgi:hypothetical protein
MSVAMETVSCNFDGVIVFADCDDSPEPESRLREMEEDVASFIAPLIPATHLEFVQIEELLHQRSLPNS